MIPWMDPNRKKRTIEINIGVMLAMIPAEYLNEVITFLLYGWFTNISYSGTLWKIIDPEGKTEAQFVSAVEGLEEFILTIDLPAWMCRPLKLGNPANVLRLSYPSRCPYCWRDMTRTDKDGGNPGVAYYLNNVYCWNVGCGESILDPPWVMSVLDLAVYVLTIYLMIKTEIGSKAKGAFGKGLKAIKSRKKNKLIKDGALAAIDGASTITDVLEDTENLLTEMSDMDVDVSDLEARLVAIQQAMGVKLKFM